MLVKLEKEIELEETLLLTEEPPPAVKTFSVCCQHGGLYQPGVSSHITDTHFVPVKAALEGSEFYHFCPQKYCFFLSLALI